MDSTRPEVMAAALGGMAMASLVMQADTSNLAHGLYRIHASLDDYIWRARFQQRCRVVSREVVQEIRTKFAALTREVCHGA